MAVPRTTADELALVKSWLLLQLIRRIFERDSKIIRESGMLKSPHIYSEMIDSGIRRVNLVMSEVQNECFKRKIRVYETKQNDQGITASYICRGYQGEMRFLWSALQQELSSRMMAYLGADAPIPVSVHEQTLQH
ncbi:MULTISPECIES: hypothetical protein [Paenibacillus]|uniref:hypothetical protein n=1 Tax=Paenibacillus TaxID=44249 RepID=UPI0008381511|nr:MULTISPECIES: hypothetical protein [Paenibacillus]GIP21261.1 hypothetical protein J22TS3_15360 [Paenibacillus sp. J22TS3]